MKTNLIVLVGLQASGKSTKARDLQKEYEEKYPNQKTVILSSDQIRLEHPEIANDNSKVFNKLYADMNYWLRQGDNVIIDSTAITIKSRKQIFLNLKEDCYKICYIMNTPYELCELRLELRNKEEDSHKVPHEALETYYHSFEIPFKEEGWDKIVLNNEPKLADSNFFIGNALSLAKGFNQQNKHHTQDLGTHMETVWKNLTHWTDDEILRQAAAVHDIGKLYTQTRGEDGNCHYYNHENVGAYKLMCSCGLYRVYWSDVSNEAVAEYRLEDTLKWLFYINYHMRLHQVTTEKSIKKWKSIFGEELYNDLRLFEKADKMRPELED